MVCFDGEVCNDVSLCRNCESDIELTELTVGLLDGEIDAESDEDILSVDRDRPIARIEVEANLVRYHGIDSIDVIARFKGELCADSD
jgi:hypothetical protein